MDIVDQAKRLSPMATEMGISLYQRFTERDAARFLKLTTDTLKSIRQQKKIGFLRVSHNQVEYFGAHILQYLLSVDYSAAHTPRHGQKRDVILRMPEVSKITGLSRTTVWRYEKEGIFPARIALGGGSVGWYQSDIDQWINSRRRLEQR